MESNDEEDDKSEVRNQNHFVENPEVVRARLAERRQLKQFNRGNKPAQSRDVVGMNINFFFFVIHYLSS